MKYLNFLFLLASFVLFTQCANPKSNHSSQTESKMKTVTGIAYNAKGGAIVLDKKEVPYYIDGMFDWPSELLEKKVSVTGRLKVKDHGMNSGTDADGAHIQSMAGEQLILTEATWKAVE